MRICTVVGARPQFIKSATVSRALALAGITEYLVHTGQHYDPEMSDMLFNQLGLRKPDRNLGIGSGSHAHQTARMLTAIDDALVPQEAVDGMLVYGDTNSTLAASLVAAKRHIPLFHVEAGLRSYNRRMPEEHNRIITDRLSDLLFCPSSRSANNLKQEGITRGVHITGDVMFEALRVFEPQAERISLKDVHSGIGEPFFLATLHRPSNVDQPNVLQAILDTFGKLEQQVVLPAHPRTAPRLSTIQVPDNVLITKPLGYLQMIRALQLAECVLTDSGGLQKEAYWMATPCITIREETEWIETLTGNWNQLTGAEPQRILDAVASIPTGKPEISDEGIASQLIVNAIRAFLTGDE